MRRNTTNRTKLQMRQAKLRPSHVSAHSDQRLHCPYLDSLGTKLHIMPIENTMTFDPILRIPILIDLSIRLYKGNHVGFSCRSLINRNCSGLVMGDHGCHEIGLYFDTSLK